MWKPMAEAIGWADIIALSRNPQGWKGYGFPQWGQFKFGLAVQEASDLDFVPAEFRKFTAG